MNLIKSLYAASDVESVVGKIDTSNFKAVTKFSDVGPKFFTPIIYLIITMAGIWALLQFILGGFGFITASGDPKKVTESQNKIMHSIIGLAIIAFSFILAALIGQIFFGDAGFILNPKIKTQ